MFDCIWDHLNNYLLKNLKYDEDESLLTKQLKPHLHFNESRCKIYEGDQSSFNTITSFVNGKNLI